MFLPEVEFGWLVELIDLAVDAGADETLCHQVGHELHVLALALGDDGREQHQLRALGHGKHLVHHLADGLRLEVGAVVRATRNTGARI